MFVIGVTGGIGSGKSTVASIFRSWGIPVIDADQLSAEVTAPHGAALPALAERIGGRIIAEDGGLNRAKLADLIFTNRALRDQVNEIIHTHVLLEMGNQIDELTKKKVKTVVLDVPLPVKEGFLDRCHIVITVASDDEIRIKRLVRRGLSESDARRRMAVQLSQDEYRALADLVIENDGDLEQLAAAVERAVLPELKKRGVKLKHAPDLNVSNSGSDVETK